MNLLGTLAVYSGLAALIGGYAWKQDRLLARARPEAWYLQFGMPVVLLLLTPAGSVEPAFWALPLAAASTLVPWSGRRLAMYLGAASHRSAEAVAAEGEVSLDDLARRHGLPRRRLEAILRQHPALPIVVDYGAGVAWSPSTASLKSELALCRRCGGATEVKGQQALRCPYCDAAYTAARRRISGERCR